MIYDRLMKPIAVGDIFLTNYNTLIVVTDLAVEDGKFMVVRGIILESESSINQEYIGKKLRWSTNRIGIAFASYEVVGEGLVDALR
jgi:hypothetical protein